MPVNFLLTRLFHSIIVVFVFITGIFFGIRLIGDPVYLFLEGAYFTQEEVEVIRERLGLDAPVHVQYVTFLRNTLRGEFGNSYVQNISVIEIIKNTLPRSLELAVLAYASTFFLSIILGVLSAAFFKKLIDKTIRFFILFGVATPGFFLGIILLIVFAVYLRWFPSSGRGTWRHLILPSFTLGFPLLALLTKLIRSEMLDILSLDYIRTARAKGLSERVILYRHALRNCLTSFITVAGLQFGNMLVFSVVVEQIFAWPGMGRLLLNSIFYSDYPVVIGVGTLIIISFTLINFVVDVIYAYLDPRVKYN